MVAFLLYIVKSTCCLTLFYLGYKALLSNETFFRFNRMVLLAGMLVCMLLPFVELRTESPGVLQMPLLQLEEMIQEGVGRRFRSTPLSRLERRLYRLYGRLPAHGESGRFTCILRGWRLSSADWFARL